MSIWSLLYVGIGGFLGANARYILTTWITSAVARYTDTSIPYGTAFVNITGSLLLAMMLTWVSHHTDVPENIRLLIGTGFFGAYTTFSTYSNESIVLLRGDTAWAGIGYIVLTNIFCLVGVVLGIAIMKRLIG